MSHTRIMAVTTALDALSTPPSYACTLVHSELSWWKLVEKAFCTYMLFALTSRTYAVVAVTTALDYHITPPPMPFMMKT
jgi:hypothetical protein